MVGMKKDPIRAEISTPIHAQLKSVSIEKSVLLGSLLPIIVIVQTADTWKRN